MCIPGKRTCNYQVINKLTAINEQSNELISLMQLKTIMNKSMVTQTQAQLLQRHHAMLC